MFLFPLMFLVQAFEFFLPERTTAIFSRGAILPGETNDGRGACICTTDESNRMFPVIAKIVQVLNLLEVLVFVVFEDVTQPPFLAVFRHCAVEIVGAWARLELKKDRIGSPRGCDGWCTKDGKMMEVSIFPVERDLDGAMESVEGCRSRNGERASDVRIRNSEQVDLEEVIKQLISLGGRHDAGSIERE